MATHEELEFARVSLTEELGAIDNYQKGLMQQRIMN